MKLSEFSPGDLYERDWQSSTDVVYNPGDTFNNELYMMLWRNIGPREDGWMAVWVMGRNEIVIFGEIAEGAEFRLVNA